MNNLPTNDEMDIIRRITCLNESTQNIGLTEAQINELASLTEEQMHQILTEGSRLEAFLKMVRGLAQKLRPSAQAVDLPPIKPALPAPSLPQSTAIAPKGLGVWEAIPQPKAPSNLRAGLRDIGIATGLGTLGYLGTRKKNEQSSLAPEGLGVSPSKAGTARAAAEEAAANVPAAPATPARAPVSAPVSAPAQPTSVPVTAAAKPVEQPMDVAVEAAKLRTARFAAEKAKATPEQVKQVEDNAKRLGVEPWTQEHYDAVGKSIEQRKQAIQTAEKELQASQAALAARQKPTSTPAPAPEQPRDVSNIVPGSQMWGELSAAERQAIRDRYAKGEGPSISIRYNKETGKFDEPGYGDQGRYGDIVRALNINESVLSYCNYISENVEKSAYKSGRKARKIAKRFREEPMVSWSGDSTTEAPDLEPETTERPHIDDVVAPHISTLIAAADKHQIDLGHGEAFDPRTKDHQMLLRASKDPAVHAASKKIGEIRSEYGVE